MADVFYDNALKRIEGIHSLSKEFNRMVHVPHQERLLELMRDHVDEIAQLTAQGDPHGLIETGDLLVLCLELLLEGGADIERVTEQCFGRYEKKLNKLICDAKQGMVTE